MSTFKFAGVSKHNGKFKFRATNRDGYADILIKEGKTDVNIQTLPTAMDKDAAKSYLATLPGFQGPEVLAVLKGTKQVPARKLLKEVGIKVAKGPKVQAPKGQKGAVVASTKTPEEIEAIKAHNLQVIREVGAKRKAEKAREAEQELTRQELDADLAMVDQEDPRDYVPKFLHKELGLV